MHRDNNYVREDFITSHITTCRLWPDEIVFMKTIIQNCYVVTGVFAIGCLNTTSILFIVSWFFSSATDDWMNWFFFWNSSSWFRWGRLKRLLKYLQDLGRRVSRLGYIFVGPESCSSLLKNLILKKSFSQKSSLCFHAAVSG